jgi:hypothetical protein
VSGIFQLDPSLWRNRAWAVLKFCTLFFTGLGFVAGALSIAGGNTISMNGTAIEGWPGVWVLTFGLGFGGFLFGLIWFLLFRAVATASE